MADSSFDIVSKIDQQEVDNAINQAQREISQRFDFKNTGATISRSGEASGWRSRPTPTTTGRARCSTSSRTN